MISRCRISCVDLQPVTGSSIPSRFLAVQGKVVHIWDLEESKIDCSIELAVDSLSMASWSPHQPLVVTASTDGAITILDRNTMGSGNKKGSGLVWKVERAHQGTPVTASYFNPFVPYWVGSSGGDGIVKVWDIRYLKNPAVWIDAHYDGVNDVRSSSFPRFSLVLTSMTVTIHSHISRMRSKFAWSNTHCERLVSISNDQSCKIWQLSGSITVPRNRSKDYMFGSTLPSGNPKDACLGAMLIAETQVSIVNPLISGRFDFNVDPAFSHHPLAALVPND